MPSLTASVVVVTEVRVGRFGATVLRLLLLLLLLIPYQQ
jgi:hypothetical protein